MRGAGAKREQKCVTGLLVVFGDGRGVDGLAVGGHGRAFDDLRALGHVELQIAFIHLRARRLGRVLHGEGAHDFQLSLLDLNPHDVGDDLDAVNFLAHVVDFDLDGRGSRRGHAVIGDALVNGADQVGALGVVEFEGEIAFGVGLGAAGFFHALTQTQQDDLVARGGLAGGGVFHGAGQGLGGGEGSEEDRREGDRDQGRGP